MALKAGSIADRKPLGMIALEALFGGPPKYSGPAEPFVRFIRIPSWRKLLSEAGLELRVVPSALLLILGGDIPGLVAVTPASAAAAKSAYARPPTWAQSAVSRAPHTRSTRTARSSPAAPTPQPEARVPAHPARVRAQDPPRARLIHAGRSGRLRGAGIVQTI